MSSTRDKKSNAGTVVDKATIGSVPRVPSKLQSAATGVRGPATNYQPAAAAAAGAEPNAASIDRAGNGPVPPLAHHGRYDGGSTSTAGTTAPQDKSLNGLVPPAKPKQKKEDK